MIAKLLSVSLEARVLSGARAIQKYLRSLMQTADCRRFWYIFLLVGSRWSGKGKGKVAKDAAIKIVRFDIGILHRDVVALVSCML